MHRCSFFTLREDTPSQLTAHVRRQFETAEVTWSAKIHLVAVPVDFTREIVRVWRRQVSSIFPTFTPCFLSRLGLCVVVLYCVLSLRSVSLTLAFHLFF